MHPSLTAADGCAEGDVGGLAKAMTKILNDPQWARQAGRRPTRAQPDPEGYELLFSGGVCYTPQYGIRLDRS